MVGLNYCDEIGHFPRPIIAESAVRGKPMKLAKCQPIEDIHMLVAPGHVPSEISVYHRASATLFAGDRRYEGVPPTTRFGGPAEWKAWISHLERLRQLDIDIICPGHGGLCSKEGIDRNIGYLRDECRRSIGVTEDGG